MCLMRQLFKYLSIDTYNKFRDLRCNQLHIIGKQVIYFWTTNFSPVTVALRITIFEVYFKQIKIHDKT